MLLVALLFTRSPSIWELWTTQCSTNIIISPNFQVKKECYTFLSVNELVDSA